MEITSGLLYSIKKKNKNKKKNIFMDEIEIFNTKLLYFSYNSISFVWSHERHEYGIIKHTNKKKNKDKLGSLWTFSI